MSHTLPYPGSIPPPAGQKANIVDPPNQTKDTIVLHTVCLTFATLFVFLRFYTRRFITRELGLDDYCCLVAWVLTITFSVLMLVGDSHGLGRHLWDVPFKNLSQAIEYLTIAEFVYLVLAGTIKLSVLLFYRRVFAPSRPTLHFIDGGIIFVLVTYTAFLLATIFECTPIRKGWDASTPGHCYRPKILPYFSGAMNVVTDLYVLIVPVPALLRLQMDFKRKLRVMAVFSLGVFACATSIIRLGETSILYQSHDATWNLSKISIWVVIEVNVGIICSCMLALPPFLKRYWPKDLRASILHLLTYSFTSSESLPDRKLPKGDLTSKSHRGRRAWSRGNGSEDDNLDSLEYYKLNGPGNRTELNHIVKIEGGHTRLDSIV